MMKKFKDWFSSLKEPSISASYSERPSSAIPHEKSLIEQLKAEHQTLINLFTDVVKLAENKRYDKAINVLETFRSQLTEHLIKENTKLYLFLNAHYRHEQNQFMKVSKLRKEMTSITKALMEFAQQWRLQGLNDSNRNRFVNQALPLSDILIKRLKVEEKELFSLYENSLNKLSA